MSEIMLFLMMKNIMNNLIESRHSSLIKTKRFSRNLSTRSFIEKNNFILKKPVRKYSIILLSDNRKL